MIKEKIKKNDVQNNNVSENTSTQPNKVDLESILSIKNFNLILNSLTPDVCRNDFYNYVVKLIMRDAPTPKNKTIERLCHWNDAIAQALKRFRKEIDDGSYIKYVTEIDAIRVIANVGGISIEDARNQNTQAISDYRLSHGSSHVYVQKAREYIMKNKVEVEASFTRIVSILWAYIGYTSKFKDINGSMVKYIKLNYFPRLDRTNEHQYTANIKFIDFDGNIIIDENYDGVIVAKADKFANLSREDFIREALNSVLKKYADDLPKISNLDFYAGDLESTDLGYFFVLENKKNDFLLINLAVPTEPLLSEVKELNVEDLKIKEK